MVICSWMIILLTTIYSVLLSFSERICQARLRRSNHLDCSVLHYWFRAFDRVIRAAARKRRRRTETDWRGRLPNCGHTETEIWPGGNGRLNFKFALCCLFNLASLAADRMWWWELIRTQWTSPQNIHMFCVLTDRNFWHWP